MKKFTIFMLLFWSAVSVSAQFVLASGSQVVIKSTGHIIARDVINNGGTINNTGDLVIRGDLENNASGLLTAPSTGGITFNGNAAQEIAGSADAVFYGTVTINNADSVSLTGSNQTIYGQLAFTSGKLTLNNFDLTLGTTDPTGVGPFKYIKTSGTGGLKRNVEAGRAGSTGVFFPVGNSSYNPITLHNSGTATTDTYKVVVQDHEPKNTVTSDMVDRSWVVTEETSGESKLTVTPQWNSGNELTGFDRTNSAVGLTADNGSTYNWKTYSGATAIGGGTYSRAGSTYTSVGTFAVADKDYVSDNTVVTDVDLASSESDCYNALNVLTIALDESVSVQNGASADFIAGQKVVFKPGFHAYSGSSTHAYITTTGDYCTGLPPVAHPADPEGGKDIATISDLSSNSTDAEKVVNVYPNPTNGELTIDFLGEETTATIRIVNFQGAVILQAKTNKQLKQKIDLRFLPEGVYVLVINTEGKQITKKVIKNY